MKKVIFTLMVLVLIEMTGYCQYDGVYFIRNKDSVSKDEDCFLSLSKGYYSFEMFSLLSEDDFVIGTLSYGKYHVKRNRIILKDDVFGYEIQLLVTEEKNLKVMKGFSPFVGCLFSYKMDFDDTLIDERDVKTAIQLLAMIGECKTQKPFADVVDGKYECGVSCSNTLLIHGCKYKFYFQHTLISEGKWRQKGNLVILKDDGFRHPMYALKEKKGINGALLPCASSDCILFNFDNP